MRIACAALLSLAVSPAFASDLEVPQVAKDLRASFADSCSSISGDEGQAWRIAFTDADEKRLGYKPSDVTLVQFPCQSYAYNTAQIWVLANEYDEAELLSFVRPQLDVEYADEGSTKARSVRLKGYAASIFAPGSSFDPKTRTLSGYHLWRGLGDAAEQLTWRFAENTFVLQRMEVDVTYDEQSELVPVVVDGRWVGVP